MAPIILFQGIPCVENLTLDKTLSFLFIIPFYRHSFFFNFTIICIYKKQTKTEPFSSHFNYQCFVRKINSLKKLLKSELYLNIFYFFQYFMCTQEWSFIKNIILLILVSQLVNFLSENLYRKWQQLCFNVLLTLELQIRVPSEGDVLLTILIVSAIFLENFAFQHKEGTLLILWNNHIRHILEEKVDNRINVLYRIKFVKLVLNRFSTGLM